MLGAIRFAIAPYGLLLSWVVLRVDVGDVERTSAVDLHDGLVLGERVVRHASRPMHEARGRQRFRRLAIERLTGANREAARHHGDELVLGMTMRRDHEAS